MSEESSLRLKARTSIVSGLLPNDTPTGMWGGPGAGVECPVCAARVETDQMELELEFSRGRRGYHLHVPCFSAWEAERRILARVKHRDDRLPSTAATGTDATPTDAGAARPFAGDGLSGRSIACNNSVDGCGSSTKSRSA